MVLRQKEKQIERLKATKQLMSLFFVRHSPYFQFVETGAMIRENKKNEAFVSLAFAAICCKLFFLGEV